MVFLDFRWKTKKNTVLFWFSCSVSGEKPKKTLCFFFGFLLENQKNTMCFFGFLLENQKNPRKNKKSKSFGPLRRVLDFWIFGFVVPSAETKKTKNPKIQNLSEGPETFGFVGFPRVFFLVFQQKSKKSHGFFGF